MVNMTYILTSCGFQHLESLKEFVSKFSNQSDDFDTDLTNIYICHKKNDYFQNNDILKVETTKDFDYLFTQFKERIDGPDELTRKKATSFFNKIYHNFNGYLSNYILTSCYVFYKSGVNSFEIIVDQCKIYEQIKKCGYKLGESEKIAKDPSASVHHSCNGNNLKRTAADKDFENVNMVRNKFNLFKIGCRKHIENANIVPYFDLPKNPGSPFQESFNLNNILYDIEQRPKWSKKHILSVNDVDKLIKFIIASPPEFSKKVDFQILKEYERWKKFKMILSKFMQKHSDIEKNNGYGRILIRHMKDGDKKAVTLHTARYVAKSVVVSYAVDVLRRVLPVSLFGNNNLKKKFFSIIVKILSGSKEENFIWQPLLQVFFNNKSELTWCNEMTTGEIQSLMILKTFKFFIVHYVLVLLKNNFYITETGSSSYSLRFYMKSDIQRASKLCLNDLLYYGHIQLYKKRDFDVFTMERQWVDTGLIDNADLKRLSRKTMHKNTEFKQPVAVVRFVPKKDDTQEMRTITNISHKSSKIVQPCPDSSQLLELFNSRLTRRKKKLVRVKLFLEYLIDGGRRGVEPVAINSRLETAWSKAILLKNKFGKLYFVRADIADAYNSVVHEKLLKLLEERSSESCGDTIQLKQITEWRMKSGKIREETRLSFDSSPKENSILINRLHLQNHYRISEFIDVIKQIVMQQRIKINGRLFKLVKGLAQGSAGKFSPLLCEIYYSSMDRAYFKKFVDSDDCTLIRGVDDYLMISSDSEKAAEFLRVVQCGIDDFNVRFNTNKLETNLIQSIDEVSYLGLNFNFENMIVRPNYKKYNNCNLLSTMKLSDAQGREHFNKNNFLEKRLSRMSALKLQPMLLSRNYNDVQRIREVILEASVLQSVRAMALSRYLYPKKTKVDLMICKVLFRTCRKLERLTCESSGMSEIEIKWLFLKAVDDTFKRRPGKFKLLLTIVKYNLFKLERKNGNSSYESNFISDDLNVNVKSFLKTCNEKYLN